MYMLIIVALVACTVLWTKISFSKWFTIAGVINNTVIFVMLFHTYSTIIIMYCRINYFSHLEIVLFVTPSNLHYCTQRTICHFISMYLHVHVHCTLTVYYKNTHTAQCHTLSCCCFSIITQTFVLWIILILWNSCSWMESWPNLVVRR